MLDADFLTLLSPEGQKAMLSIICDAKANAGPDWLESIKTEFPNFVFIVDLVANHEAEVAFDRFRQQYPLAVLYRKQLLSIHGVLRAEIDRPR